MPEADRVTILRQKMDRLGLLEARENYESSLYEFVKGAWSSLDSSDFQDCWALESFCDHLESVTLGYIPRLLANLPPRCGKTTIASICWPAWTWAREESTFLSGPGVRFLCASYNQSLSFLNANQHRRLLDSPWYQKYWADRFHIMAEQNAKAQFDTDKGGRRQSTSVGGSLLGLGGDVICVDDPANTETEKVIETDADRQKVKGWWREMSGTRLNDPKKSAIVVVMQRLHEEDLSGIILESDETWVHYCVPMEYDTTRQTYITVKLPQYDDPEPWQDPRTVEGELMWPERFGPKEIERMKAAMGPYMASGRLQQLPVPKGGGIIKDTWWQPWDNIEAKKYGLEWKAGRKEYPTFELVVASLDTSYGQKQENDFNAMTVWGIWLDRARNRRAMLTFAWQKRLPIHGKVISANPGEAKINFEQRQKAEWGLIEWVADTCKRYHVRRLLIEDKTRGRDVGEEINRLYARENWGVQLVNPVGDKVSRAHSVVPLYTDNAVYAPEASWSSLVINECAKFPKGTHDDIPDACFQFLIWARENGILGLADETAAELEDHMRPEHRDGGVAASYGVGG
jgi:predicted phage terminase large subunit-like protein